MQQFRFGEAVVVQGLPGTTHASVTADGKVMILLSRGVVNAEVQYVWREDNTPITCFSSIVGPERVHIYGCRLRCRALNLTRTARLVSSLPVAAGTLVLTRGICGVLRLKPLLVQ